MNAIIPHKYQDLKKYKFTGKWNKKITLVLSDVCLVCGKQKENHDTIYADRP